MDAYRHLKERRITLFEFGWFVGLLEGEASFQFNPRTQRVQLRMTDFEIVEKSALFIDKLIGTKLGIHTYDTAAVYNNPMFGEQYQWVISGENARIVMKLIVPFMGKRRRAQIWRALNKVKNVRLTKDFYKRLGIK